MYIFFLTILSVAIIATIATGLDFYDNMKTRQWLGRFPEGEARDMAFETVLCVVLWSLTLWSYHA